jgi:hypothetical protein
VGKKKRDTGGRPGPAVAQVADAGLVELVRSFSQKTQLGLQPTAREQRAYDRFQREETERRGLLFAHACPKKIVCEKTGRQTKSLHDSHRQHNIPLFGATVDLFDALRAALDRLTEYGKRNINLGEDPLLAGADSPGLERYRNAAADVKELERDERLRILMRRDDVRDVLGKWAALFRGLGDRFVQLGMNEAHQMLNDALLDCDNLVIGLDDFDGSPGNETT